MVTEAERERSPDVVAGRARLDAQLKRLSDAQRAAFWEAVRRCYAGPPPEPDTRRPA